MFVRHIFYVRSMKFNIFLWLETYIFLPLHPEFKNHL